MFHQYFICNKVSTNAAHNMDTTTNITPQNEKQTKNPSKKPPKQNSRETLAPMVSF